MSSSIPALSENSCASIHRKRMNRRNKISNQPADIKCVFIEFFGYKVTNVLLMYTRYVLKLKLHFKLLFLFKSVAANFNL